MGMLIGLMFGSLLWCAHQPERERYAYPPCVLGEHMNRDCTSAVGCYGVSLDAALITGIDQRAN